MRTVLYLIIFINEIVMKQTLSITALLSPHPHFTQWFQIIIHPILVLNKEHGLLRGAAFVRFPTVAEACHQASTELFTQFNASMLFASCCTSDLQLFHFFYYFFEYVYFICVYTYLSVILRKRNTIGTVWTFSFVLAVWGGGWLWVV